MKKFFGFTAILLLVAMFATVFVGCEKNGEEQDVSVKTKFENIVSEKISQEKWNALLGKPADEINNFRLYMYEYDNYGADPDSGDTPVVVEGEGIMEVKDGVMHEVTKIISDGREFETLICPDEDNLWRYFAYNARPGSKDQWAEWKDEVGQEGVDMRNVSMIRGLEYEDIEYSEEYKGYVYEEQDGNSSMFVIIKILNGNLAGYRSKYTDNGTLVQDRTYVYCDFGKVEEIKIPEAVQELLKVPYDGDMVFSN